jgi:hypothetical protein
VTVALVGCYPFCFVSRVEEVNKSTNCLTIPSLSDSLLDGAAFERLCWGGSKCSCRVGPGYDPGCQIVSYIFKPNITIWVNFGGSCNERCWQIRWSFGLFCCHLVYCIAFCVFFLHLVHFFPVWNVVPRNIWQPWVRSL